MLRNKMLMVLLIGIALFLTANVFGQENKKRKSIKRVNGVTEYGTTDVSGGGGGTFRKRKTPIKRANAAQDVFVTELRKKPKHRKAKHSYTDGGVSHTDSWNEKTKRKPRPKSIIILDQDGETEVTRRKGKRNK